MLAGLHSFRQITRCGIGCVNWQTGGYKLAFLCKAARAAPLAILMLAPAAAAQQLSFRHYDVADGLAGSHVQCIYQDSKGYLWFGTWEGLCRFDGYQFTTYGVRDGLRNPIVNCIAEDKQGRLWVGTNGGGIARFEDGGIRASLDGGRDQSNVSAARFTSFSPAEPSWSNQINNIVFDDQGTLWCAT